MFGFLRPQKNLPRVFCDPAADNAYAILKSLKKIKFTADPRNADLLWLRDKNLAAALMSELAPQQVINHLPGQTALVDKGNLWQHLSRYNSSLPREARRLHSFFPETYCLFEAKERAAFFALHPKIDQPSNLWIIKPTGLSRGEGIKIVWEIKKLAAALKNAAACREFGLDPQLRYIAQRYIKDPLLLEGRKSEMRLYWLIASIEPLAVLLYHEGTVRLNTLPFSLDHFDNPLIHITNVYQQKQHADYDAEAVLKWSFSELNWYLEESLKITTHADFLQSQLFPQLREIFAFVSRAVVKHLTLPRVGHCFGLYGADIILDAQLRPWLTEIQIGPGLSFDDPIKEKVVPAMLKEAVMIMLEVRDKKIAQQPLNELGEAKNFSWVVKK